MDSETEKFYYYLDECYFHPERDKKYLARKAMEFLWNKPEIKIDGVTYFNTEIRKKLLGEMMPEILDRAVEIYRTAQNVKYESAYLATCIFGTLINYDAYIERLFNQTFYN